MSSGLIFYEPRVNQVCRQIYSENLTLRKNGNELNANQREIRLNDQTSVITALYVEYPAFGAAAVYLASDASAWVTGSILVVAGGAG